MLFWIIAGIVGLGLYFLSQNKTEKRDKTTITHKRVIQTNDGEVHISQTQVIDSVRTTYTKQDASKQIIKDVVPAVTHIEQQLITPKVQNEPLIISPNQPHRFAHHERQLSPKPQESKADSVIAVPPKVESKDCPNCERELPFSSFGKSGKYIDGLTKWCIECLNAHQSRLPKNQKNCPKCKKTRLKSSFYKNSNRDDGLTKWCKTCMDNSRP